MEEWGSITYKVNNLRRRLFDDQEKVSRDTGEDYTTGDGETVNASALGVPSASVEQTSWCEKVNNDNSFNILKYTTYAELSFDWTTQATGSNLNREKKAEEVNKTVDNKEREIFFRQTEKISETMTEPKQRIEDIVVPENITMRC